LEEIFPVRLGLFLRVDSRWFHVPHSLPRNPGASTCSQQVLGTRPSSSAEADIAQVASRRNRADRVDLSRGLPAACRAGHEIRRPGIRVESLTPMSSDLPKSVDARQAHAVPIPLAPKSENSLSASSSARSGSLEFGLSRAIYGIRKLTVYGS